MRKALAPGEQRRGFVPGRVVVAAIGTSGDDDEDDRASCHSRGPGCRLTSTATVQRHPSSAAGTNCSGGRARLISATRVLFALARWSMSQLRGNLRTPTTSQTPVDPAEAAKLLEAAGFAAGRSFDGRQIVTTLSYPPSGALEGRAAELATAWRTLGIAVETVPAGGSGLSVAIRLTPGATATPKVPTPTPTPTPTRRPTRPRRPVAWSKRREVDERGGLQNFGR